MGIYVKEDNRLKLLAGVMTSNGPAPSGSSETEYTGAYDTIIDRINEIATECQANHNADETAIADIASRLSNIESNTETQLTSGDLDAINAAINNLNTTLDNLENEIQTNTLSSTQASISQLNADKATIGDLTTQTAVLPEIQNHRIKTEYLLHNTEYIDINESERAIVALPFFVNGVYKVLLKDKSQNEAVYLSVEVLNSANNFIVKFSNSEKYTILPLASVAFYNDNENNSQCYLEIKTNGKSLRLWYSCDSYNTVTPPTITSDWPIDINNTNVKTCDLSSYTAATLFNRPIICSNGETSLNTGGSTSGNTSGSSSGGTNASVDIKPLIIGASETYTKITEPTVYSGSTTKTRIVYTPDQSVNSTEAVKFLSVEAPFLNVADLDVADYFKAPNIYNGVELSAADLANLPDETLYIPRTGGSTGTITSGIAIYNIPELPADKETAPVFGDQIRYYSSSLVKAFRGETFIMDEYKPQDGYSLNVDSYNDVFIESEHNQYKGLQTTLIKNEDTNELYIIIPQNRPFISWSAIKLSDIRNDGTYANGTNIGGNQYMPNMGISTSDSAISPPVWTNYNGSQYYIFGNLPVPNERFYINSTGNTIYLPLGWYTVIYPNIGLRTLGQITWTKAGAGAKLYRKTTKNNVTSVLPLIPYREVEV